MRVVLIPGTWDGDEWYKPTSPWAQYLASYGHEVVALPSYWSMRLDGLRGRNEEWALGGQRLARTLLSRWRTAQQIDALVGWSHGGNVAAYALGFCRPAGLHVRRLVTLGTPPRWELEPFYTRARSMADRWLHAYGGSDWWQYLGQAGDGMLRIVRGMPHAHINQFVPGARHSDLVSVHLVAELLKEEA